MLKFPDQIPLDSASAIIAMGRDGTYKTKQHTFGELVWNVAGYGMNVGLKDASDPVPVLECSAPPPNLGELCDVLEHVYREASVPQAVGIAPIILPVLMVVIQQAIEFLKEYLGRK